jgi:hypothetical protein
MLYLLVAGRVVVNAWTSVVQKQLTLKGLDPLLIVAASFGVLTVLVAPAAGFYSVAGLSLGFWGLMMLSALFDTPGNVLLVHSVRLTDLSLIGPLNAYKPIVAMLLGLAIGEVPDAMGLAGIGIIFGGSLFLSPGGERAGIRAFAALARDRGVQLRTLSLGMTALSAVILKAALAAASPAQVFIAWALVNTPVAAGAWLLFGRERPAAAWSHLRTHAGALLLVALLFLLMQYFTLQVFARMHVAYALSIFQLSALLNVFFGYRVFHEQHTLQRAIGSAVMIVGAAILILNA